MALKNHMDVPVSAITRAGNEPSSPRHWLIAWAGLVLIWVAMFAFMYGVLINAGASSAWSWPIALGLSIGGFVKVMQWVLPALTGDLPAVREIERTAETTIHRTDWEAQIWGQRLGNEAQAESYRHTEEMARISAELQSRVHGLSQDVADLRRGLLQYSGQIQRMQPPPEGAWVAMPSALSVDEEQALAWAIALYADDGKPDPKKVVPNKGHIQIKVPWNSIEGWQSGATSLLVDGPNGFQPVLMKAGGSHNYKLNLAGYPTVQEIQNALGKVTAEGWVG